MTGQKREMNLKTFDISRFGKRASPHAPLKYFSGNDAASCISLMRRQV